MVAVYPTWEFPVQQEQQQQGQTAVESHSIIAPASSCGNGIPKSGVHHEPLFVAASSDVVIFSDCDMSWGMPAKIDVRGLNSFNPKIRFARSEASTATPEPESPRISATLPERSSACETRVASHMALAADEDPSQLAHLAHTLRALKVTPKEVRRIMGLFGQQQPQTIVHPSGASLRVVLDELRQTYPRRVLKLRRVHRLPAESVASLLCAHFRRLGPVDEVHIVHSQLKQTKRRAALPKTTRLAFVVLHNLDDVEAALQLGSMHVVGTTEIGVEPFYLAESNCYEGVVSL